MPSQRSQYFKVVYDTGLSEDVYSFIPMNCFFVDPDDSLKLRLAYSLSSILYTLYASVPKALEYIVEKLGYKPVKYELEDPVDVSHVMYHKSILKLFCRLCPERGVCPWLSALESLKVH
ncbi:MAG: hypothetical protein QXH21_07980 [Ignisphaera sp.]